MISTIPESIAHLRGARVVAQGLKANSKTDMVTDSLTVDSCRHRVGACQATEQDRPE